MAIVHYEPTIWQNTRYQTWRTRSLFIGHVGLRGAQRVLKPVYTLATHDQWMEWEGEKVKIPSFRRLYLEIGDPTEYRQATDLLGGWAHLQALLKYKWFDEFIKSAREELEIQLRSAALLRIIVEAQSEESRSSLAANRYLADGKYKVADVKRGRPSNVEIENELQKRTNITERAKEDMKRMGLVTDNAPPIKH